MIWTHDLPIAISTLYPLHYCATQLRYWRQKFANISTVVDKSLQLQLIDWAVDLHPTRYKIGHLVDVPQANLLAWYGKTKPNATEAHIRRSKEMYYNAKK